MADPARLKALEDLKILDSGPEAAFDEVVELAAAICRAPIASISFVDRDRQWSKAQFGCTEAETPIEDSLCLHALREPELLVVPDLTLDRRTRASRSVTGELGARFYAGAVIKSPDGHPIGAVCVMDHLPRPEGLSDQQKASLLFLAAKVSALIWVRRALMDTS